MQIKISTIREIDESELTYYLLSLQEMGVPQNTINGLRDYGMASWIEPKVKTIYEIIK